jgi:hypothetical protein
MADNKREMLLNTVRNMMARANDPRTPEEERDTATTLVSKWIAKHQIEDAELREAEKSGPSKIVSFKFKVSNKNNLGKVRASALHWAVVTPLGGTSYKTTPQSAKYPATMTIFMPEEIVEFAKILLTSLSLQMETGLAVKSRDERRRLEDRNWFETPSKITTKVANFRKGYLIAFGSTVGKRIKDGRKEAVQEARQEAQAEAYARGIDGAELAKVGSAIALRDTRELADAAMNEHCPGLKTARQVKYSVQGYIAGKDDGNRADIGLTRVGGSRTALTH